MMDISKQVEVSRDEFQPGLMERLFPLVSPRLPIRRCWTSSSVSMKQTATSSSPLSWSRPSSSDTTPVKSSTASRWDASSHVSVLRYSRPFVCLPVCLPVCVSRYLVFNEMCFTIHYCCITILFIRANGGHQRLVLLSSWRSFLG